VILLQGISKSYGSKKTLQNIDLSFEMSKTHVLIGSSGCGKSTLLRILMGLIRPTSGTVKIDGVEVNQETQKIIAPKIGYVIQDAGLFPHLTVSGNVKLPMKARKISRDKMQRRLEELRSLVGLDKALFDRYPSELSGGQKQRVGLMRALALDPPLLLLDEPLGALDPIVRSSLQEELKRIFNTLKKTVIIVTHDLGEAAYFGHTITVMNEGRVLQKSLLDELINHPADPFVTEFLRAQRPPRELEALK
jgi:osmoprotectant transport system ATP-binding protein